MDIERTTLDTTTALPDEPMDGAVNACCSPTEQETCCEPSGSDDGCCDDGAGGA